MTMRGLKLKEKEQIELTLSEALKTFKPMIRVVMFFYLPPELEGEIKVIRSEHWDMPASTSSLQREEEIQRRFDKQKEGCAHWMTRNNIVCQLVVIIDGDGNKHLRFKPK